MQFLLGQQCDNGGFPETFGAATCTGSVDATGFAVQALATVGGPAATDALTGINDYTFRSGRQTYQDVATAGTFLDDPAATQRLLGVHGGTDPAGAV